MAASSQEREQFAVCSLETAGEWRRKGDVRWELTTLSSALGTLLGVAVERFSNAHDGIGFLVNHRVGEILDRVAEINQFLYQELHRATKPVAGAVNNHATPVHIAWLMRRWESGQALLTICLDPLVRKFFPLTPFWAEYHRGLGCLAARSPYEAEIPKTRGYEQYWVPYLRLMADLTHSRDTVVSRQEIAQNFLKRNRDKRLTDWEMIDGDGKHPVCWDFREASILLFAEFSGQNNG
jgi:hypothetical protein